MARRTGPTTNPWTRPPTLPESSDAGTTDVGANDSRDAPGEVADDGGDRGDVSLPPDGGGGSDDVTEGGLPLDAGGDAEARDAASDSPGSADAPSDAPGEGGDAPPTGDASDGPGPGDAVGDAPAGGPDTGEAGTVHEDGGDSGSPGVACDPSMPFGQPLMVYGLNRKLGTNQRITLSPDELTAYVSAGPRIGETHISIATRTSRADPFGPLVPLGQLNGPGHEIEVSVTADGLKLFFDTDWTVVGQIAVATRQSTSEPFGSPSTVQIEGEGDKFCPYVVPNGLALYFNSNPGGAFAYYRVPLDGTTPGTRTIVWPRSGQISVVSADELTLYYATDGAPAGDLRVTSG